MLLLDKGNLVHLQQSPDWDMRFVPSSTSRCGLSSSFHPFVPQKYQMTNGDRIKFDFQWISQKNQVQKTDTLW